MSHQSVRVIRTSDVLEIARILLEGADSRHREPCLVRGTGLGRNRKGRTFPLQKLNRHVKAESEDNFNSFNVVHNPRCEDAGIR